MLRRTYESKTYGIGLIEDIIKGLGLLKQLTSFWINYQILLDNTMHLYYVNILFETFFVLIKCSK